MPVTIAPAAAPAPTWSADELMRLAVDLPNLVAVQLARGVNLKACGLTERPCPSTKEVLAAVSVLARSSRLMKNGSTGIFNNDGGSPRDGVLHTVGDGTSPQLSHS